MGRIWYIHILHGIASFLRYVLWMKTTWVTFTKLLNGLLSGKDILEILLCNMRWKWRWGRGRGRHRFINTLYDRYGSFGGISSRLFFRRMMLDIHICMWLLRPRQNGRHFADGTFKYILLNENVRTSIKISLKLVPKYRINNIPALV